MVCGIIIHIFISLEQTQTSCIIDIVNDYRGNDMEWIERAKEESSNKKTVQSFEEYMDYFSKHSKLEARTTGLYLADMLDYFGRDSLGHFKLFQMEHHDSPPIFGQYRVQEDLYQNLTNFQEEGFNSKFILLVGPNGSAKSSLIRKLMRGAEEYSKGDAGALFTFSWIFPVDTLVKGKLGLSDEKKQNSGKLKSYANLDENEVSAILPSELKDHPLLLIPRQYRQEIIKDGLKDDPSLLEKVEKTYLYLGDLSKRNRMIYDALLKSYKGDHGEVLKHIRVERWHISRRYSTGAVTVEPQMHVDAHMQQITMDKRLASLPPSLQSLNLFTLQGEAVLANRGILEFSDLLKRPIDAFKYLLMTMETSHLNLQGILTMLDVFFVGTSNELHLEAFKQHPDFKSFKGRFNFVTVPYLTNYREEMGIYKEQLQSLRFKSTFAPHTLEMLSLFSVMTRLRSPMAENYQNPKLKNCVMSLNPLEKAKIYAGDIAPARLDMESRQVLEQGFDELEKEFSRDLVYEGRFGISPRDVKKIIYKLTTATKDVTFMDLFEFLKKFVERKNDFDFLNMQVMGDYHNATRFIALLESYAFSLFDSELRDSLGLVDNRSYEQYIRRYIQNINGMIKHEKVKNELNGRYEEADQYFVQEFEKSINLQEDHDAFRSQLIGRLGAYSLDNPKIKIVYTDVFPQLVTRLKESFKEEQDKVIKIIATNLIFYQAEVDGHVDAEGKDISTPLSEENRERIKTVVNNLMERYNYTFPAAATLLKQLLKVKY